MEGIGSSYRESDLASISKYVGVNHNLIKENGTHGVLIRCENSSITGNHVINNGNQRDHQGIVVQAVDSIISTNCITGNGGVGIDLGNSNRCIVSGNLVTFNGLIGIEVNSTEDATVSDNLIMYNNRINYEVSEASGILVHQDDDKVYPGWTGVSKSIILANNRIVTGNHQNYGIFIKDKAQDVVISNNILRESGNIAEFKSTSPFYLDSKNLSGASQPNVVTIASSWDMTVPHTVDYFKVSGTTTINSLKFDGNVLPIGKRIVLQFTTTMRVNSKNTLNGNILLQNSVDLITSDGTILEVICDGTQWVEINRSIK